MQQGSDHECDWPLFLATCSTGTERYQQQFASVVLATTILFIHVVLILRLHECVCVHARAYVCSCVLYLPLYQCSSLHHVLEPVSV